MALRFSLLIGLCALCLTACGKLPNEMRAYLLQDGAWGWDKGRGCEGLKDAWVVEGKWIQMYKDGKQVDKALLQDRRLMTNTASNGSGGKVTGVTWHFVGRDPDHPDKLGRHDMRFSIRGGPGRKITLVAWKKYGFMDAETKKKRTIKTDRAGQRLLPCSEMKQD